MKIFKKLMICLTLAFSFNTMASSIKIISFTLKDNSKFSINDISKTHLQIDKTVDFIELKDGSKIEGSEIKNISLENQLRSRVETLNTVRMGDGSGG